MIEWFKKTLLTGVGLALLSKEKVDEIARDFVRQAGLTEEKGQAFVDQVKRESERAYHDLESRIGRVVTESMHRMNVPTRDEIERLTARIEELERSLAAKAP